MPETIEGVGAPKPLSVQEAIRWPSDSSETIVKINQVLSKDAAHLREIIERLESVNKNWRSTISYPKSVQPTVVESLAGFVLLSEAAKRESVDFVHDRERREIIVSSK
jgi:uncharacterized coiled-coil protein SlyX